MEHDPVLTLGRHADDQHVIAGADELDRRGIEVIRVERGGEVTYHGPGQLVAYPIVRLADRGMLLRPFVRALERSMTDVAAAFGVVAGPRAGYPGTWVEPEGPRPRKLGALGLRLERGITYHGIALNISTRLADFALIDPCGLAGLDVTSVARELGWTGAAAEPSTAIVEEAGRRFAAAFERRLDEATPVAPEPLPAREPSQVPGGLFELRRDDITGWWVATVVDRDFDRSRFARPARRLANGDAECQNCRSAPNERAWVRSSSRRPSPSAPTCRARPRSPGSAAASRRAGPKPPRSWAWACSVTWAPGRRSWRPSATTPCSPMRASASSSRCWPSRASASPAPARGAARSTCRSCRTGASRRGP